MKHTPIDLILPLTDDIRRLRDIINELKSDRIALEFNRGTSIKTKEREEITDLITGYYKSKLQAAELELNLLLYPKTEDENIDNQQDGSPQTSDTPQISFDNTEELSVSSESATNSAL